MTIGDFWRKLTGRRRTAEAELDDEIGFHIAERTDELVAAGIERREAREQAAREFGARGRVRAEAQDAWTFGWAEEWYRDTAHAARGFAKQWPFSLAVILSLALGIGVNLAIFGIVSEFFLRDPSVRDPQSLYIVTLAGSSDMESRAFALLRDSKVLPELTGFRELNDINWRNGEERARLYGTALGDGYFEVTGTPMAMGRGWSRGESNVVVISDGFWRGRLGADPNVLGRALTLNGAPYTITGVLPADHRTLIGFGFAPDIAIPARREDSLRVIARLPEGMSPLQAIDRLRAVTPVLDQAVPRGHGSYRDFMSVTGVRALERFRGSKGLAMIVIVGLVGTMVFLVLAIACANIASLLLARAASRRQEFAVRASLGAGRGRLLRQMLSETLLLAGLGSAAGVAVHWLVTQMLNSLVLPIPIPIRLHVVTDSVILIYAAVLAIAAALLAGLLPALRASRVDLNAVLKSGERQMSGPPLRLRRWLLGAQVAASVLLIATGLLCLRSLDQTTSVDLGLKTDTIWARMTLMPQAKAEPVVNRVLERLRAHPAFGAVAFAQIVPFNDEWNEGTTVGLEEDAKPPRRKFHVNLVSGAYFEAIGIPLRAGRTFRDRVDETGEVVISESLARLVGGGTGNLIGRRLRVSGDRLYEIIGVAADSKHMALGEVEPLAMYRSIHTKREWRTQVDFLARPKVPAGEAARIMRDQLIELEPAAAVEAKPFSAALGLALLPSQAGSVVFGAMGILGLVLSTVGLYGTVAYSVRQRTAEIGLRMALGAAPRDVLALVLRENIRTLVFGGAVGFALAMLIARPLAIILVPGVAAADPASLLGVMGILAVVATLAIVGPARRAMRIDPLVGLRME